MDQTSASKVDVGGFIDAQTISRFQIGLLLMCASVLFVDGFDAQAIGYTAPSIVGEWHIDRTSLGPVFSAGLFGLMIGALLMGPLADRIGRKRIIVLSVLAFGLGTLATVLATDTQSLLFIRFATGLGLGGALPNAVALTAEYSPQRRRATMVMAMFAGFSVGAALGGLLAAAIIPAFGWRSVYVVGGVLPLLMVPWLAFKLPESLRFQAMTGRANDAVRGTLQKIAPAHRFADGAQFVITEPNLPGQPVAQLLRGGRALATVLIWIMFFMSLLDIYFLSNWLPLVLNGLGSSVSMSAAIGAMLQVGGLVGALALGRVFDRFSYRALPVVYLLAAGAVALIGYSSGDTVMVTIAIFVAGFGIIGGQNGANAMAATFYPTSIRSTGVGWAFGIGRIGSIIGPLLGGALLARHWSLEALFSAAAVAALCASLAAFGLTLLARRD